MKLLLVEAGRHRNTNFDVAVKAAETCNVPEPVYLMPSIGSL